ncbi:MAG TPA: lytic transglycosylase domain-containing protein, partial [bacterium]|nr:lytic transglycosylase domain-containing protein [bacterium]
DHTAAIREAAARRDLDPALVAAVIYTESGFETHVQSSSGAIGLMQIMPRTAELLECKYDRMYDPDTNIRCGVKFLAALLTYTKGDLIRAISGYNGGSHSTEKSALLGGRIADNPETKNYVKKVLGYYEAYKKSPPCGAATTAPVKKPLIRPNPITAEGGNDGADPEDRKEGESETQESGVQSHP